MKSSKASFVRCLFVVVDLTPGLGLVLRNASGAWGDASEARDDDKFLLFSGILNEAGERIAQHNMRKRTIGADVDAWLHMAHKDQPLDRNIYSPILVSVQDALEEMGLHTRIVGQASNEEMLAGVKAAVAGGKTPLVVAVALWWSLPETRANLKICANAGAKLILYQTEPPIFYHPAHMLTDASEMGASEVWDYSKANVAMYPNSPGIAVRLVPPGYSPDFEVGVDLQSPSRMEDHIGFMGNLTRRSLQDQDAMSPLTTAGTLFETFSVWTKDELRAYLDTYPVQLNLHAAGASSMEAFRFAILLSNRACIISDPGDPADNAMWEGVIHLVTSYDIPSKLKELQGQVESCQNHFYDKFKQRFQPLRILQESGFTLP